MERFYFHTQDGRCLTDQDGDELPDLDAAKDVAVRVLAESLRSNSPLLLETGSFSVIVTDDRGLTLFTLDLVLEEARLKAKALP